MRAREHVVVMGKDHNIPESHLNAIYAACDFGVNASEGEGFGLTHLEQAAAGVPQIWGQFAGLDSVLKSPDCGVSLVPRTIRMRHFNDDGNLGIAPEVHYEDIAHAIMDYLLNPDLYLALRETCLRSARSPAHEWAHVLQPAYDHITHLLESNLM